jgi:hypothetical protein
MFTFYLEVVFNCFSTQSYFVKLIAYCVWICSPLFYLIQKCCKISCLGSRGQVMSCATETTCARRIVVSWWVFTPATSRLSVDTENQTMLITLTRQFVRAPVCRRLVSPPSSRKQVTKIITTTGYKYNDKDEPPGVVFVWAVTFGMSISKEVLACWFSTECMGAARLGHLIILNPHVSFRHTIYFKSLKKYLQ